MVCTCSAVAVAERAGVWGTDVYSIDSHVCRAALHAGAVGPAGGAVRVIILPGLGAYLGNTRNGVESRDYGPWTASFQVTAVQQQASTAIPAPDAACPANFLGQTAPLACHCPAESIAAGTVRGAGVYASNSALCRAARHAGVIGPEGGLVNAIPAPGVPAYAATTANGVTTEASGAGAASFSFRRVPPPPPGR